MLCYSCIRLFPHLDLKRFIQILYHKSFTHLYPDQCQEELDSLPANKQLKVVYNLQSIAGSIQKDSTYTQKLNT